MGLIGPGFVAAHHIDAVRRLGDARRSSPLTGKHANTRSIAPTATIMR